jgi:hypothetical protein
MSNVTITYKGVVLVPLAALEAGQYAAMVIIRKPDNSERASGVLGHFASANAACQFAIEYGMAQVDQRELPQQL